MRAAAYDGLMLAVLEQLRNLDTTYGRAAPAAGAPGAQDAAAHEADAPAGDPLLAEGLAASNPAEMQRFINLAGERRAGGAGREDRLACMVPYLFIWRWQPD